MSDAFSGILFDNDALSLLAAAGLVQETLDLFGIPLSQVSRLESLTHMLLRRRIGRSWTDEARATAVREAHQVQVCRLVPDEQLTQRLVLVDEIDEGEAFLVALLTENPHLLLVTGDKRSLRALSDASELEDVRAKVAGRIVCLEAILQALVRARGAMTIGQAFQPVSSHVTLRVVFTSVNMSNQSQCLLAIDSYYRELRGFVAEGFLFEIDPPFET